jgi:hypothetical protein
VALVLESLSNVEVMTTVVARSLQVLQVFQVCSTVV